MRTAQETSRRNSSTTGYRPDLVQRKCACGGSSSIETECEDCKRNKIDVQRYSARRESTDTLISRFVTGSRIALPDSSDNPSALGHSFSQIRVHQNTKPTLQTKLRGRVPSEPHEEEADRIANLVTQPLQAASAVRREPIESSQMGLAVQRAPDDRSEQSSEAGKEAMPQTATPTEKSAARSLIVEDGASVGPGQMRKSDFLARLNAEIYAAADEILVTRGRTAQSCPYITNWFDYGYTRSGSYVETFVRRFTPGSDRVATASEYIPLAVKRLRRSLLVWADTGEITGVPEDLASELPSTNQKGAVASLGAQMGPEGEAGATGAATGLLLGKAREGSSTADSDPRAVQNQLRAGEPLDSGVKTRMESAFGYDFSRVRIHHDSDAARLSTGLNARAFTIGYDVAFAAGEYTPGTLIGDALLAHELAHVVQQGGGQGALAPKPSDHSTYGSLEDDADRSAIGAVVALWGGAGARLSRVSANVLPSLRSGLRLSRCGSCVDSSKKVPAEDGGVVEGRDAGQTQQPQPAASPCDESKLNFELAGKTRTRWRVDYDSKKEAEDKYKLIKRLRISAEEPAQVGKMWTFYYFPLTKDEADAEAEKKRKELGSNYEVTVEYNDIAKSHYVKPSMKCPECATPKAGYQVWDKCFGKESEANGLVGKFKAAKIEGEVFKLDEAQYGVYYKPMTEAEAKAAGEAVAKERPGFAEGMFTVETSEKKELKSHTYTIETACPKGYTDLGTFFVTSYVLANEGEFPEKPTVKNPCGLKGTFRNTFLFQTEKFPYGVKMEGSGKSIAGDYIHYAGGDCFEKVTCPLTASTACATAGRTVAVDPKEIYKTSKIPADETKKVSLLIEDVGSRVAEDSGGKIKGKRIDVYQGETMTMKEANKKTYGDKKVCKKV
jgi:3D (Asp-Asp-Asp) domain-containing protein